ncbi:hypothetical protein G6024_01100 [Dietzia maris]|nr:hypothetical protein [Dietzia maris]MBB0995719.1 hypothetical protein [Dietzia maris]
MDYRDYMDDETSRLLKQTREQMLAGMIPKINQPTFDITKFTSPTLSVMDQFTKQTGDIAGTAIMGDTRLQDQLNRPSSAFLDAALGGSARTFSLSEHVGRMSASKLDAYLGSGVGTIGQALEALKLTYKPPTIADYLARTNTASIFSFQGPSIAEQIGTRIDTKSLMGLTGLTETAGTIAEQWRLANKGALSNFGESFGSLREALNFEQSLKSSGLAQAVLSEAWKLDDEQAHRWAEADLTETADTRVEEELEADRDLAEVVGAVQRYFVVYLGYTPSEAHNLVRRLVWILLFGTIVGGVLLGPQAVVASIGAISAATSKFNADSLIPDGKPDMAS